MSSRAYRPQLVQSALSQIRRGAALCVAALLVLSGAVEARRLNGFNLDDAAVPERQVEYGGLPRDAIPAINNPNFVTAGDAEFLAPADRVLGVEIQGGAKAYPVAILNWHEVVNDRIGTQYFVVSYCPLCGTGMVFASNVQGSALKFGVSGLLYNSDLLLYDRKTESLWSQIMGEAITGKLKGTPLLQLPSTNTTWADWRATHPQTLVLSTDTGYRRDYRRDPYGGYLTNRSLLFRVANKAPASYHPKALVMGIDVNGVYKAYPFVELKAQGKDRFQDEVNGVLVTIIWNHTASSATAVLAAGTELPTTTGYWFAWYAFHPESAVFKAR